MRTRVRAVLLAVVLLPLAPASALAGICFSVTGLAEPAGFDFSPLTPSADGVVPIVGEAFGVCGAGAAAAPIHGTAVAGLTPGVLRIGFSILSNRPGCAGGEAEVSIQPPYTSASGRLRLPEGSLANLVLTFDPTGNACQPGSARPTACVENLTTLCLQQNRFRVTANRTIPPPTLPGQALKATTELGYFHPASGPENIEVLIKVLNACAVNNRYWVLASGVLSNVEYTITVTDTQTGTVKTYANPVGQLATQEVQDRNAFACP